MSEDQVPANKGKEQGRQERVDPIPKQVAALETKPAQETFDDEPPEPSLPSPSAAQLKRTQSNGGSSEKKSRPRRSPPPSGRAYVNQRPRFRARQYGQVEGGNVVDYGVEDTGPDLDQIISTVATDVSQKISRISRVSLAAGWDVGTSPEETSEDLMLGLRDGLCGALSSFSSWISSMVLSLIHI